MFHSDKFELLSMNAAPPIQEQTSQYRPASVRDILM
jgi:hypothetical protein